jgi:hypothetical protein
MATMQDISGLLFGQGGSGLEDYLTAAQQKQIQQQGMLSAAAALLSASGTRPVGQGIGIGQALGGALMAGQQGYTQAQQGAIQNLMAKEKLREAKMNADWAAGNGFTPVPAGATPTAGTTVPTNAPISYEIANAATPVGVAGGLPAPAGARTPTGMVNVMGVDLPAAQAALLRQLPRKEAMGEIYKQVAGQYTQMSPAEVASFGLPAGSIVYRGPTGKPEIISKPDQYSQMTSEEIAAAGLPSNSVIYKSPQGKPEIISRPDYELQTLPNGGMYWVDKNNPYGKAVPPAKVQSDVASGNATVSQTAPAGAARTPPAPAGATRTPPIGGAGGAPVYAGGFAPALKPEQIMTTIGAWDKDYRQPVDAILSAYGITKDLVQTGGGGISDYGVLIKAIKALDPNSAVMQGEADSARQMQGMADRMLGYLDKIEKGGVGGQQARIDLMNLARSSANVAIDTYNRQAQRKAQLVGQYVPKAVIDSTFQPFIKPSDLTSKAQMEKETKANTVGPVAGKTLTYDPATKTWGYK